MLPVWYLRDYMMITIIQSHFIKAVVPSISGVTVHELYSLVQPISSDSLCDRRMGLRLNTEVF